MPILNQSSNIPGMMIEFRDGGLELRPDRAPATTRSILLLGTANDGPVMNPVAIDATSAEAVFGKGVNASGKPNGATLPEAFSQAYKEGCRDIRMMRISGSVAKATLDCQSSVDGGTIYDTIPNLGSIGGNDQLVFTLPGLVNSSSVKVYAAGKLLDASKFDVVVSKTDGSVTIHADAVSVGTDIKVTFTKYIVETEIKDNVDIIVDVHGHTELSLDVAPLEMTGRAFKAFAKTRGMDNIIYPLEVDSSKYVVDGLNVDFSEIVSKQVELITVQDPGTIQLDYTLKFEPKDGIIASVKNKTQGNIDFTIVGNILSIDVGAGIIEDDELEVIYNYIATGEVDDTTNIKFEYDVISGVTPLNNSSIQIAESAVLDSFILPDVEIIGDPKVYVEDREVVIDGVEIAFNSTTRTLTISRDIFTLGSIVGVRFGYRDTFEVIPSIQLESLFGGNVYNEMRVKVESISNDKKITIIKPLVKKSSIDEADLVYLASDHPTLGMLINAINSDINNNVVRALVDDDKEDIDTMDLVSSIQHNFAGGDNGLAMTRQSMFEALKQAYMLLQNYRVDIVVPLGVYADEELLGLFDNFAYELGLFCGISSMVHLTHGIISVKPPKKTDLASIDDHVDKIEAMNNIYNMIRADGTIITDTEGNPFDLGGYLSILAGQELTQVSNRIGIFNDVGTVKYAAMLSKLKASSAPTNKKFDSISGMKFSFSVPQLNRIANKRMVTFHQRASDNAIVITDGVTAAKAGSDYSRVAHINVIREILDDIYAVAEPYIGEPISAATNNALNTAIDKKLTVRKDPLYGDIQDYEFYIVSDPMDKLLGNSKIELTIVPHGERRRITIVTSLKKSLQ